MVVCTTVPLGLIHVPGVRGTKERAFVHLDGNNRLRRWPANFQRKIQPSHNKKKSRPNMKTTKLTNTICNSIKKAAPIAAAATANNSLHIKYSFRMPNFINAKQILLPKNCTPKSLYRKCRSPEQNDIVIAKYSECRCLRMRRASNDDGTKSKLKCRAEKRNRRHKHTTTRMAK